MGQRRAGRLRVRAVHRCVLHRLRELRTDLCLLGQHLRIEPVVRERRPYDHTRMKRPEAYQRGFNDEEKRFFLSTDVSLQVLRGL